MGTRCERTDGHSCPYGEDDHPPASLVLGDGTSWRDLAVDVMLAFAMGHDLMPYMQRIRAKRDGVVPDQGGSKGVDGGSQP